MNLRIVGIVVVAGVLLTTAVCIGAILAIGFTQRISPTGDHVAVVRIHGVIVTRDPGGLFGGGMASAESLVEQIEEARTDGNVRAILLDIDSPGGSATASEIIHAELVRASEDGIPIVAFFGDTAASGGYYVAAPADQIVSMPNTITGSIGVIATVPNLQELYEKIGVDMQVITSGPHKDMLQASRPLTDEERAILQSIIDESYADFVRVVADGRGMSEAEVRELADGRIYTGRQAQELGLVDQIGDLKHAIAVAGDLAGLGPDPELVDYTPSPGFWDAFFGIQLDRLGFGPPIDLDPRTLYLELKYSLR
jgi:protease IV